MSITWNNDTIREHERQSIRAFMENHSGYLRGRVMDFGAGKLGTCREPEPYRDLVDGEYVPYDKGDQWPDGQFDCVICNQVLQYVHDPRYELERLREKLQFGGHLVLTYATCWDEVEQDDLWRFTKAGMSRLLRYAGFDVLLHERRAGINLGGFTFALGYGVLARPS